MTGPTLWVCYAMIANTKGGYGEMGTLNATNQWFIALVFFPTALSQTVLPLLSQLYNANDLIKTRKLIGFSIMINGMLVLIPAIILSLLTNPILRLYGPEFRDAGPTLIVTFLTAGLLSIQIPIGQFIAASGKMWAGFVMNMGWAVSIILFTMLSLKHGAFGFAVARVAAYVLNALWTFAYGWFILKSHANRNRTVAV